ncbi:YdcF family protein [Hansschlegelia zhihuaiae]|uniref:YdcF family protein n=1 Tax=Hansschlegelia zhihuaiae TaxID=405005 RepID=A0A4Q0MBZ4_9HYPH|nr:YdcF family protein [Hansschlegelia zhihuaiae]RXF70848.1 YdcF family protein [Hansschlegelia zhihuaiae]
MASQADSSSELAGTKTAERRGPSTFRRAALASFALGVACAAIAFAGFLNFVSLVPVGEQPTPTKSDGIVALTGGAERLSDALRLLASGRGQRLLISGVHPETTERELARAQPDYLAFARCCVDLGRRALNTAGNAVETRRWAVRHGFRSLIVVTSGYHMPRTMMELAREMPNVDLIPYAVSTERLRGDSWWRDYQTTRVLAAEYVKYVAALVRVRLAPRLAKTETVESRDHAPGSGS